MATKMTGMVMQFGTKGYGFIKGDDNEKYFVHQKNVYNQSRLEADTRVVFKTKSSEKGWMAVGVTPEGLPKGLAMPLSNFTIKALFLVLFIAQIVVMSQVFISG